MSAAVKQRVTPEQYLAAERLSAEKHEYLDGEVIAMPGVSREHNLINLNLARVIGNQILDRPTELYGADVRVLVAPDGLYTYPDLMAVVDRPLFLDAEVDTLLNPTLIVEILSPTTQAYDRGEKFAQYRRLESLREYVLVAQDRVAVERFSRRGEDWLLTIFDRPDHVVRLESIGCEVPMAEVYRKVEFPGGVPPGVAG